MIPKIYLFNTISSLNIAVPDEEENIGELFILVENYINNKHSRFNNKHVYNFLDYQVALIKVDIYLIYFNIIF